MAVGGNFSQCANGVRFHLIIHCQIGTFPITKDAETHKTLTLAFDLLHGIFTTLFAEGGVLDFDAGFANLLFYVVFNGQTVTIPTGNIRRIKAAHGARFNDNIFKGFVYRMTQVNLAVGVRRAIVKNILFAASAGLANLLIEIAVLPFF